MLFAPLVFLAALCAASPVIPTMEEHDVKEGETVLLECPLTNTPSNSVLFWTVVTPNASKSDVVAIKDSALRSAYTVALKDDMYTLEIDAARYERDNGIFYCEAKQQKSGKLYFSREHKVTILMAPGEPRISPPQPFAEEGKPYNLTCESVGGSPDPDISWVRNGQEVPSVLIPGGFRKNPTRAILTVIPTKDDDRSQYTCMVRSRALPSGTHLDTKVTLRVSFAPKVTVGDEVLRVMQGEDAVLSCKAEGNPEVRSIKWYRDGQLVSNSETHVLKSVNPDDAKEYSCVATNGIQPDGRATVKLDVLYGPRVQVISEREANQNDRVTVNCQVESNPEPSKVYWIRESDEFRQEGPVLNIERASARDNGLYYCVAEVTMVPSTMSRNQFESKVVGNATLQLNVKHEPGLSHILPKNPIAVVKKSFTLECTSEPKGYPKPEYRWWKKGSEHTDLSRRSNYTILSVHPDHEGYYFCQPMNALGKGSIAQVYLQVNEAPHISDPLRPQVIRKTGDVPEQISCRAAGKPKPAVWWTHNGQNISTADQRFSINTKENTEALKAVTVYSVLNFAKPLTANERGRYACHYSNGFGDPAMSEMTLRVEHSPEVRHTYNRVAFDVGDTAYLECRMQAYPEPTFEWTYRSRTVGTYNQYSTNRTDNGEDIYTGLLKISNIKEDDYGDYTCRAFNKVGQDQRTIIKLVKRSQPDRPTDVAAVDIQSDRITLAWRPGFNGGYADTKFTVNIVDENGRERNETCLQSIPCTITGLESLSRYAFKVMASNPRGFSSYSEPTEVYTRLAQQDMPLPIAQYDFTNGMVHVSLNQLPPRASLKHFVIRLEARVRGEENFRLLHEAFPIHESHSQVEVDTVQDQIDPEQLTDVRAMVCLQSNLTWCGDSRMAEAFNHEHWISTTAANSSLSTISTIVTICVGIGLFCLTLVLLCCCWKKHSNTQQTEKKDYNAQLNSSNAQPPCYYDSMTKSGIVETAMDEQMKSNGAVPGAEQPVNGGFVHVQPQYLDHDPMYGTMMNTNDYYIGKQDPYSPYDPTPGYFGYPDEHSMADMHYDVSGLPNPYGTTEELLHGHYLGHTPSQQMGDGNCNESVDSVQTNGQRRVVREIIV